MYQLTIQRQHRTSVEHYHNTLDECLDSINTELNENYLTITDALNNEEVELDGTNKKTNMNMLFIELLPNYHYIIEKFKTLTKQQFLDKIEEIFNIYENPRKSLFYKSCQKSEFELIYKNNNQILFNKSNYFRDY